IKKPYPDASKNLEFILTSSPSVIEGTLTLNTIQVPVKNIVVTSTTHIPMLELLGVEKSLVGFQDTNYISSEKTRKRIDSGFVRELGNEAAMNTEVLFELQPDVVIGFAMNSVNKTYNLIEKHGIPVIINGDWLEETPLGRAEWIKFFGVLFDKEKEADSLFRKIEQEYLAAIAIAKKVRNKPSILSGAIMRNDIWSLPAGESFVAQFLEDANVNYLWKDSKGKGSLQLSFESVLDKAQKADYWIAPGYFSSKAQLIENNPHYKNFTAFKTNNIYTASTKKGVTGGIIYYELGPTRPDLILKDLIKITNPTLLPNYKLNFFEQMK
ncbi:ABC transporter substrate-binding protein, partial [Flavobacteriaceae bacterium]|nr:ABC transporter substrate-binding protein [Flavobacteriaceae bacterium]